MKDYIKSLNLTEDEMVMLSETDEHEDDIHQFLTKCSNCNEFKIVARPIHLENREPQVQMICLGCGNYTLHER